MRKILLVLLAAVFSVMAHAQTFTVNDAGISCIFQILSGEELQCEVYRVQNVPDDAELVVPASAEYNGKTYQVVELANYAYSGQPMKSITIHNGIRALGYGSFKNCTHLESITIPEGTVNTYETFQGCTSLKSVTLPSTLRRVGQATFNGCTALTSVVVPNGVTEIGYQAFMNCTGLTTIDLPASLTIIDRESFEGCASLSAVKLHDIAAWCNVTFTFGSSTTDCSPTYQNPNGCHLYLNEEEVTELVIPAGVTTVPQYAFANLPIVSAVVPEGVTSIARGGFAECNLLESVTLPSTLVTLNEGVFYNCSSLTSLELPASLTSIGTGAFNYCSSLQALEIPEGVTTINSMLFNNCSSLRSLVLPHSLTSPKVALLGCSNVTLTLKSTNVTTESSAASAVKKLILTNQVESIANRAFESFVNLKEVEMAEGLTSIGANAFARCTALKTVGFPETLNSLGQSAFMGCTALTSATLPSVSTISNSAFKDCSNLASVVLPTGITSVGDDAFRNCTSLSSIVLPEGCTQVGYDAFRGCDHLTSVTVPYSMEQMSSGVFDGCTALTNVTLNSYEAKGWFAGTPVTTVTLGAFVSKLIGTFSGCTQLESISLPNSLMVISGAFRNCTSLESIAIPSSVTLIGDYSFYGCTNLASLEFYGSSLTFERCAFEGCTSLTSVTLPSSVTTLSERLFAGCTNLSEVTLPYYSLTTIGVQTFEGCTALQAFVCPSSLTQIQNQAFKDCTGLKTLTFSDDRTITLQTEAFAGCTGLTTINFPQYYPGGVTISGDGVFSGCSGLTTLTIPELVTLSENYYPSSDNFLKDCTGLKKLIIYSSSAASSSTLTNGCTGLEEVEFYSSTAGPCVAGRTSLQRASVHSSVMDRTFQGCTSLTTVTFPEPGVLNEIQGAFVGCSSLPSFTAPGSLTSMSYDAFANCTNLRYLDLRQTSSLLSTSFSLPTFEGQNTFVYLPESFQDSQETSGYFDEWGNWIEDSPSGYYDPETGEFFPNDPEPSFYNTIDWFGSNTNVVCPQWGEYRCSNVSITDGRPVGIPESFKTGQITNTRTIAADVDAYTLCLPYPLAVPDGLKVYTLGSCSNDGTLVFTEILGSTIEANQPYLVVASSDVSLSKTTYDEVEVPATPNEEVYVERGAFRFCGTVTGKSNAEAAAAGAYILQANNEWHPVMEENASATIPAGRSYLIADQIAGVKSFASRLADTPTAVNHMQLIDHDGTSALYDLSGRRLSAPTRGINIMRQSQGSNVNSKQVKVIKKQ